MCGPQYRNVSERRQIVAKKKIQLVQIEIYRYPQPLAVTGETPLKSILYTVKVMVTPFIVISYMKKSTQNHICIN